MVQDMQPHPRSFRMRQARAIGDALSSLFSASRFLPQVPGNDRVRVVRDISYGHADAREIVVPPEEHFLELELVMEPAELLPGGTGSLTVVARDRRGEPVEAELSLALVDGTKAWTDCLCTGVREDETAGPYVRFTLTFLVPIAFAVTVPAQGLIGQLTDQSLLGALALAAGLFVLARLFWRFGIRYYSGASA